MHIHNAWIVIEPPLLRKELSFPNCMVALHDALKTASRIGKGDWVLVATPDGNFVRTGQVLRLRFESEKTIAFFDRRHAPAEQVSIETAGLSLPENGAISQLQWDAFYQALPMLADKTLEDISLTDNPAYIRALLQLAVVDDLLGPANGPHEQIVDMSVRDRYLVGRLAPVRSSVGSIKGLEDLPTVEVDNTDPIDLNVHKGRHEPGAEFEGTTGGRVNPEAQTLDETDTASQSLIPSSFGLTFCVSNTVKTIAVEARWGHYQRDYDTRIHKTRKNPDTGEEEEGARAKVWQRIPKGGKFEIELREGPVPHRAPDSSQSEVRVQGTVHSRNTNGDRLVTLFLVNAQEEPTQNKDSAWIFQPELIVRAASGAPDPTIFRRRLAVHEKSDDPEMDTLEMVYRKQVEFAVGHGVAVHAETGDGETERAAEIRTVVMPQYEVPVTETPGFCPEDRPGMCKMIKKGYLDMRELADMGRAPLFDALSVLTADYAQWIAEQRDRIGSDVVGFDKSACAALDRCAEIHERLVEGIRILIDEKNDFALKAFRFTNAVMAEQRIHSIYALARHRGEKVKITDFDKRKHRSWQPFQLAFILLSLPALANPTHVDRTKPVKALADLLWFPTGGGKTEAYLGVAAFAMAIRRMQGEIAGYDGSRGLTVIMRYTLRLLTLQQFQRATALICAMEVARLKALAAGDGSLGTEPFTIGLWVGNTVTPGTTKDSHAAIKKIRDSSKSSAGWASPSQLASCPWCGSNVSDEHDIEVDCTLLRTKIYCGDTRGHCEFSKEQSRKRPHPGLPVLVVDEEIYHRPPTMMIATVDKFAMMAWRGETRTLFGCATTECVRHGLLWPEANCEDNHQKSHKLAAAKIKKIHPLRPPDLIIQDEFHLINGPLGTMVGLYESAVDELCTWKMGHVTVKPKVIASTATVRKAEEQVNNVFMRRVAIFPPSGLDVTDNFFSVQRSVAQTSGRRYLGVCSPGSSRPGVLIRVYTAFLTAAQALFDSFGSSADPYLTTVGYFNSLRELGGMRRLAEDDVQTRCYRVQMGLVDRPGLSQRNVKYIRELTSRVSNRDIPKCLGELEVKFKASFDKETGKFATQWDQGETRSIDVVLATNMLSVGIDVNRLGLMVVNGQPKNTAEYIQATSRVGRFFPGLVCTVLTWARPRDLSHYETFEHYHATFYKHVEALSATPFSPRAMDRGLTGTILSVLRLKNAPFNPNTGARALDQTNKDEVMCAIKVLVNRAWLISGQISVKKLALAELKARIDEWVTKATQSDRMLAYEKKGPDKDMIVPLLHRPGIKEWNKFTVPMSMREVESGVRLVVDTAKFTAEGPDWTAPPAHGDYEENTA